MNRSACAARGAVGALFAIGAAGTLGCAGRGVPSAGHEGLHNQSLELEVAVTDDLEQFRTRSTFRYEVVGHGADIYFAVPGVDDLASLEVILDGSLVEPTDLYRTPHPVYSDGDVVRLPATAGADRQGSHELVVSTPWLDPPESSFARWGSWHPFLGDRADPVPIELTVEVPAKLRVVASGRRTAEDVREGIRRSRWRTRNPQGWVFLAVGRYTDRTFTEDGVHVQVWTPAEHEAFESVDPGVLAIEPFRVLRFLEGKLGPSGIDTVRLVFSEPSLPNFSIDGLVAGSSATAARVTTSPEYLRGFLAHELAHYWFGDLVRSRGPGARWMTEGFAEYWRSRYEEAVGADPLPWSYRNQVLLTTFDGPEMPALTDRAQGEAEALYYQKGAYVLYMLERLLGHLALDATMRRFIDRHRGSVVGFQAFFEVAEDVSDRDLAWFVRQWLGRPGAPYSRIP